MSATAPTRYSVAQIVLHWTIAALVLFQFVVAGGIETRWQERMTGVIPNEPFPTPHTIAGIVILGLMLVRLAIRLRRGAPLPPEGEPPVLARLARIAHAAFYVILILMPVGGAVAWFGGYETPAIVHGIAAKLLLALVVLHVVAALAHKFWFRSGAFERMLRPGT
jgi:cytochrome b561